jgi:hypothetical protein
MMPLLKKIIICIMIFFVSVSSQNLTLNDIEKRGYLDNLDKLNSANQ